MVLIVDIHPKEPGLASVSVSLVRCLMAAIGVSVYQPLLSAVGPGWAFMIFALSLLFAIPMALLVRYRGPKWRGIII